MIGQQSDLSRLPKRDRQKNGPSDQTRSNKFGRNIAQLALETPAWTTPPQYAPMLYPPRYPYAYPTPPYTTNQI
jgi:hypothetical protein